MKEKVFIDSDVILDVLLNRQPFSVSGSRIFEMVREKMIEGCTSPIIICNIHYLLTKEIGKTESLEKLKSFRLFFGILPVYEKNIDLALMSGFPDFEDAVQYYSALDHSVNFIITRNKRDFSKSIIPVMTAGEYISYHLSVRGN